MSHAQQQPEPYPYLAFLPAGFGRRAPYIVRSRGLNRLHEAAAELLSALSASEKEAWCRLTGQSACRLPVGMEANGQAVPVLVRPDVFLWGTAPTQLSLDRRSFFQRDTTKLSDAQLRRHLEQVVRQYLLAAALQERPRSAWLADVEAAYLRHPFLTLARQKADVVEAVEQMNRSSLLAVLKYPEDIAYWRHRVEIVLRPYRALPEAWRNGLCEHEKELYTTTDKLVCHCTTCAFTVYYHPADGNAELEEEVLMPRAIKRIATIERQLNEIAEQSLDVIGQLRRLQGLKKQLLPFETELEQLSRFKQQLKHPPAVPVVDTYEALIRTTFPTADVQPELQSLAGVHLHDTAVLAIDHDFFGQVETRMHEAIYRYEEQAEKEKPKPDDVVFHVKRCKLTQGEKDEIDAFLDMHDFRPSAHQLAKTLAGIPTNKVRSLGLHETPIFGLLQSWPEKQVVKAVHRLFV
ncbi:RQC-minor-2 family DNA-binding protein [Alkalicoccus luteus]|uniref:RQC-minor-2 family DNA-binding protein n=1 Tax=Alkalicoccus luteus TaxID=1237094 RepID=UPI0040337163